MTDATTETALLERVPGELLINGDWVPAEGSKTFEVLDPATGESIKRVASASPADGAKALDAAVAASESWAITAPRVRGELLRQAWELLQERADEFALLMTIEMGKPLAEARAEVNYGGEFLRWFGEEAVRVTGRYGFNPEGTGRVLISKRPVGPCFFITPWNFPLAMATRKIAPALAAGCTVVIKPAELTPLTTLAFAALLQEVGLPAGVVNVVPTNNSSALSAPIIDDPRLRKLSFTGSTEVGRTLLGQAAKRVLRTSMELGGNAPFLVFADADLDAAVEGALLAKFRNIGQACTAANRFLVQREVANEFAAKVTERVVRMSVGRGTEPGITIGPLINEAAVISCRNLVKEAVDSGAKLLAGGNDLPGAGFFFEPTVVSEVPRDAKVMTQEIFGPVLGITAFDDEDDAVALANGTEFGLVSYVYTRDLARAHRMIDRLESGMTGINVGVVSNAAAPFGGIKQSGLGREGGLEGIQEFLETKYSLIPV